MSRRVRLDRYGDADVAAGAGLGLQLDSPPAIDPTRAAKAMNAHP